MFALRLLRLSCTSGNDLDPCIPGRVVSWLVYSFGCDRALEPEFALKELAGIGAVTLKFIDGELNISVNGRMLFKYVRYLFYVLYCSRGGTNKLAW